MHKALVLSNFAQEGQKIIEYINSILSIYKGAGLVTLYSYWGLAGIAFGIFPMGA